MPNTQFHLEFFDPISKKIFEDRKYAFVGISPFNSYFNQLRLEKLFAWVTQRFQQVFLFVPDTLAVFTLEGLGYNQKEAQYKTKRQDSYLLNKLSRACKTLGEREQHKITLLTYSGISRSEAYQVLYSSVVKKFETDEIFRTACLATTKSALISHEKIIINNSIAVEYLLREFPIFIDVPKIINVGSIIFIYHLFPSLIKQLYQERTWVSSSQGCLQLSISSEAEKISEQKKELILN